MGVSVKLSGRVEAVNKELRDSKGKMLVEVNIMFDNTAIQVKSEGARGLVAQMQLTREHTDKTVIGYAPDLRPNSPQIQAAKREGFKMFTTEGGLLKYLEKNQSG